MQGAQLVDVVDCRCILGEGVFYSAGRQEIIWVDIQGCNIHTLHWQTRKHQTYKTGSRICWLKECENGNFIAGFEDKICLLTPAFLTKTVLWTLPANAKNIRLNDAKVDRTGRLFFGTMDDLEVSPVGQLFALGSDGGVKTVQQDFVVSNGPAFSPCGQFMYSVSSAARTIYRLKLNASGNYSEAEVFIRFTEENGFPDGITVDAENNIWVAGWDGFGVFKFSQQGRLLEKLSIDVPKVTSVAFAGPDMKHIAVTSARKGLSSDDLNNWPGSGNLFIYSVPVTGISEPYIIN